MKKKLGKIFAAFAAAASSMAVLALSASAAETVGVKIAPYYTEIDYMSIYNPAVEYPLLCYKDITYMPMTGSLCDRLGLAIGFDEKAGLYITKHPGIPCSTNSEGLFGGSASNGYDEIYTAVICEYPIYINGIRIDNTKEEYPFLNFRDITYFPITYRFAVCDLGFEISWTQNNGIRLFRERRVQKSGYFLKDDKDGVNIAVYSSGQEETTDAFGSKLYTYYGWYDKYRYLYQYGYAAHLGTFSNLSDRDFAVMENIPECEEITLEDGTLGYMDTTLLKLCGAVSQYSREFVFDGITFIHTTVHFGQAPAPYTSNGEYIFVKKDEEVTQLKEWDGKNNLARILPDGEGGYFLCSDFYSPINSSRWSNEFASVYHYNSKGEFSEIKIKDTNSVTGVGVHDGRLYVKAMYYGAEKSAPVNITPPISSVNSGFYQYSPDTGECRKLYPYIEGELFFSPEGEFFCLSSSGMLPRLVNLGTGVITELE